MNPEKYNPGDILKGYAKNSLSGKRNLKDKKINVLPSKEHWDKAWRDGESTSLVFTESSREKVNSQVTQKILALGRKYGIEFWLADDTYPMHSSLTFAYPGYDIPDEERVALYKEIEADPETQALLGGISGPIKLEYKYLILNGDNITLNAVDIPESIVSFRRSMGIILERYNLPVIRTLENFLHITVARIKKLPNENYEERVEQFKRELRNLRREISKNPIQLETTGKIFMGTNQLEIP